MRVIYFLFGVCTTLTLLLSDQVEGVGSKEVAILFGNMDRLLKLAGRFFLKLNARIGQWDTSSTCLGDLFVAWLSDADVGRVRL